MYDPPIFATVADYVSAVSDKAVWDGWAREALMRSGLTSPDHFYVGDVGTFPTLIGANGLVVKLFADLCDGLSQYEVELAAYRILAPAGLPTPRLVATGILAPERLAWRWPYLIITVVPGKPYARLRGGLDTIRRIAIARQLGSILRELHRLPLPEGGPLRPDYGRFAAMLARRRLEVLRDPGSWGSLREHLGESLDEFLPDPASLLVGPPVFVHTDVHADHVFVDPDRHYVSGLIDFADAFAADQHYELVTLHLCMFDADKTLLSAFLSSYGWPPRPGDWPRRMLAWTMLHEWNILARLVPAKVDPADIESLDHLATILWDVP